MRLKDVDPIIRELQDEEQYGADYFLPIELLKAAPTIEAKLIVRAHWEEIANGFMVCSHCEESVEENRKYSYCPICGAQMDEFASDNNVGSKGVKIPVISMEDVPKVAKD